MDSKFYRMINEHKLYGLAYDCPYLNRKNDCPFKEIDHFLFQEKVDWIEGLNVEIKAAILEHHRDCSRTQEELSRGVSLI